MSGEVGDSDCSFVDGRINEVMRCFMMLGSEVKEIESTGGVLEVVQLLRRVMTWGVVDILLLWKEMVVVSDGWDIRSWDFHGRLVMPSPSNGRLRWLRPCLLLVSHTPSPTTSKR